MLSNAFIAHCNESRVPDHTTTDSPEQQEDLDSVAYECDLVGAFNQEYDRA